MLSIDDIATVEMHKMFVPASTVISATLDNYAPLFLYSSISL